METKTNGSTYTWNARVMKLAKRLGDGIRERERDELNRTLINTGA